MQVCKYRLLVQSLVTVPVRLDEILSVVDLERLTIMQQLVPPRGGDKHVFVSDFKPS